MVVLGVGDGLDAGVCVPADAVEAYRIAGLDALVMGPWLVKT